MERNVNEPSQDEAAQTLASLTRDRDRLVEGIHIPWSLMAAFGALGAWFVGAAAATNPGAEYEPPQGIWMALLGVLVVGHLVQREMGIRFRTSAIGARATWAITGILGTLLALFSASLGLVASDMRWAVVITSLVAFGITTGLAGVAYRCAVENIRRD